MTRPPEATLSTGTTLPGVGIAVSPHYLASQAGADVLRSGGNAIDAAIAVNATLGVVLPDTCGPGGDLFALIQAPGESEPITLNSSGRGGSGFTADDMRDKGLGEIPFRSPWSVTVPGCVDGWIALNERFGRLTLGQALAPAISLAREGFPVSEELSSTLHRIADMLAHQESKSELYAGDEPPAPGATMKRPQFADSLERVAELGRDGFYQGAIANGITAASGGLITADDLGIDQAEWIQPASLDLFGRTGWTIPPNSQGYLVLATLKVFEQLDPPTDPNDPQYTHLLIEAYRSVAWEREDTVGEPTTAEVNIDELLSPERLGQRTREVARDRVTRWPVPKPRPGGTAFLTVLDGDGVGISLIQSNFAGIGSGLSAGETGVWLQNRGAGFNLIQGHPNEFAAGKRPLHTLSPTLWTTGNELDLLLGTRGGDQQPQFLSQFAAARYHAGLCTDDAQALPRWNMEQPAPGVDSAVRFEDRFGPSAIAALRSYGHEVTLTEAHEPGWGPVSAIDVGDERKGSADPRISTAAAITT